MTKGLWITNPQQMVVANSISVAEVLRALDERAFPGTAEEWDTSGLLAGDPAWKTSGAILAIDLSFEAVELAKQKKYSLILNHHPAIFPKSRGLSRVVAGTPLFEAIRNGIAVAAYHTSFDQCALEVVHRVSQGLGIQPLGRFLDRSSGSFLKLVTFVPVEFFEKVRVAVCDAGAGHIGNYDHCTFGVEGEGAFRGGGSTNPLIGKPNQLERVREVRLETIFPKGLEARIIKALLETHPYEEVAYDLYSVHRAGGTASFGATSGAGFNKGLNRGLGYGFWGEFPSPRPFSDVAKDVKSLFNIHGFWITNPVPPTVSRVGFVAGKGGSFVDGAAAAQCDLFITGEAGYHTALSGSRRGVAILEMGHRESEMFFIETMKDWLSSLGLGFAEIQTSTQMIWQEV